MTALDRKVSPEIINNAERVTLIISGEDLSLASKSIEFAKAVDALLPTSEPPKAKVVKKAPSSHRPAR